MPGDHPASDHQIRPATTDDVEPAVQTLVKAFENYPMTRQLISADDHLDRLARYNRLFLTHIGLPHGRVWVTPNSTAVAVWITPQTPDDAFSSIAAELREISGDRADLASQYGQALGILRPREPVWTLIVVGVDPAHQRQGLGRAVLAPGLAAADADQLPAFLETQDPANVAFYETLGFEVIAELDLPENGPRHWSMYRRARQLPGV